MLTWHNGLRWEWCSRRWWSIHRWKGSPPLRVWLSGEKGTSSYRMGSSARLARLLISQYLKAVSKKGGGSILQYSLSISKLKDQLLFCWQLFALVIVELWLEKRLCKKWSTKEKKISSKPPRSLPLCQLSYNLSRRTGDRKLNSCIGPLSLFFETV